MIIWSIVGLLIAIGCVIVFAYAYKRTKNKTITMFLVANVSFIVSYITFILLFAIPLNKINEHTILVCYIFVNSSTMIGMVFVLEGLIYNHHGKFPWYSHVVPFLGGVGTLMITDPTRLSFIFAEQLKIWIPVYDFHPISIFLALAIAFFIYSFVFIIKKFRIWICNGFKFDATLMVFIFVILWIIAAFVPMLKPIRLLLSPLLIVIMALPVLFNPLSYITVNKLPYAISLVARNGVPFYVFSFHPKYKTADPSKFVLLNASSEIAQQTLSMPSRPSIVVAENFEAKRIDLGVVKVGILATKVLPQYESVIYYLAERLNQLAERIEKQGAEVLSPQQEKQLRKEIIKAFKVIACVKLEN